MSISIDHSKAEKIILESFRNDCKTKDIITRNIETILSASHKTYKYVLVTGILAKATCPSANPITLQAGAQLKGAYDARSLCHKVLVPFERDFLHNILGGSNEPFLNKPARFTHLSKNNAVRKGKDKDTLLLLIETLSSIKNGKAAKQYLACAFDFLRKKIDEKSKIDSNNITYNPSLIEVYEFSLKFIEKSFEGETSAILVGTLESLLLASYHKKCEVITHKVNQSGASSKEVGDIDVFINDVFSYAIEVKDKNFTPYDLEHAFNKIKKNNGSKGAFIYGLQASFDKSAIEEKIAHFEEHNFFILFTDIRSFVKSTLFKMPSYSKKDFSKTLLSTAKKINCKDTTREWILQLMSSLNWL